MDVDLIYRISCSKGKDMTIEDGVLKILSFFVFIQYRKISCGKSIIIYIDYHNSHKSHSIVNTCFECENKKYRFVFCPSLK